MKKRKAYKLTFVTIENRGTEIIKQLARNAINEVCRKNGAVCTNLDEVLNKYIR